MYCNQDLVDFATLDEEGDDYSEYKAYSDNEKMAELSDIICPEGKVATSFELHEALERLADTNDDGFLSREEFEMPIRMQLLLLMSIAFQFMTRKTIPAPRRT